MHDPGLVLHLIVISSHWASRCIMHGLILMANFPYSLDLNLHNQVKTSFLRHEQNGMVGYFVIFYYKYV